MTTSEASSSDLIVDVRNLSRRFGKHLALDRVSLTLQRGSVLGLVGVNGSGKTTLIKHLMGLLAAQEGSVRIFGLDPVADPVGVLSRIGFLSEDCDLPGWMRIGELLRYSGAFYKTWDAVYAERLCREFGLDLSLRVRALSRGQKARAGLVVAPGPGRTCWCWTSRRRGSIRWRGATSWRPSFAQWRARGERCCSPRTCSTRSSAWPTTSP